MKTTLLRLGLFVVAITAISTGKLLAFTAVTDGNWTDPNTWGGTAPSGNVSNQDIIIPSGIDVILNTNVTFSGVVNNFKVDGTLTSTTNNQLTILVGIFSGSGDVDIQRIIFNGALATYTHSGDLTANTFANMGSTLAIASHIIVTDTLNLDGGTFTLNTGGNLMINTNALIIRKAGTLVTSGGVFNSAGTYKVRYTGTAKTTGLEINSLNLLNMDISLDGNTTILTLGSDMIVNGSLELNYGILSVGANDLEIRGTINILSGAAVTTTAASNLTIQTGNVLNSGLVFTAGSSMDKLTIKYSGTGTVKLQSPLSIAGELQLNDGILSLESGATLTMSTGSLVQVSDGELESNGGTFIGTASYDVEYNGGSNITTGLEITGSGLNDVTINTAPGNLVLDNDVTVDGVFYLQSGDINLNSNNLVLNGTFEQETGSMFIGNANSDLHLNITTTTADTIYFDASNQSLEQLVINVTGGNIVLGTMVRIHDELTFMKGNLQVLNDNLVIEQNADITGYTNASYVMTTGGGKLKMYVAPSTPYLVFPVGTATNYSPASIQQAAGSSAGNFMVKAFNGVYDEGNENSGYNAALTARVVNRTWLIESDATTLNTNLKLGWAASSEANGFNRAKSFIAHYANAMWDIQSPMIATAGANGTFEVSRTGITSLSPFAVSEENAKLRVNEETALLTVTLYPNPCTDAMNISYDNSTDTQYTYELTDVAGRSYAVVDNGTNQLDVSKLNAGVYLLRMTNKETNKSAVKQFVKN